MSLRFCPEEEVQAKKQAYMDMKFQLSMKLKLLKDQGKIINNLDMVSSWVEENFD